MLIQLIEGVYRLLWGDLLTLHLGNVTLSLSFMVILLLTAGVFFTLRTRLLPVRLFRDMLAAVCEKNDKGSGLSSFQTLVVSTATRVGMGNLVGVVTDAGLNWCAVTTILDTTSSIGATVFRTEQVAVAQGQLGLMSEGQLALTYVDEPDKLIAGDLVVTSGLGGYYPSGLPIGTVTELRTDTGGLTQYAVLSPKADIGALTQVFLITEFDVVE